MPSRLPNGSASTSKLATAASTGTMTCYLDARVAVRCFSATYQAKDPRPDATDPEITAGSTPFSSIACERNAIGKRQRC